MKFVTLAKTFETVDPHRPLIKVTLEKGTRFAIRKGNMFENGDYGYHGKFHRVQHFGYATNLMIPYEYLTKKSVENLKKVSISP
jgi:hypothetical protein